MINMSVDFSASPAGRYVSDGPNSGARFRDDFLLPALSVGPLVVNLNGAKGYGPSFLDEAFGGLVRNGHFTKDELHKILCIGSSEKGGDIYAKDAWLYIDAADNRNSYIPTIIRGDEIIDEEFGG